MTIFVSLGNDVKQAVDRLKGWRLQACPACGVEQPRMHDRRVRMVPVGDGAGVAVEMEQRRWDCRSCGLRITVLPDCHWHRRRT